jgi:hypothetical protein
MNSSPISIKILNWCWSIRAKTDGNADQNEKCRQESRNEIRVQNIRPQIVNWECRHSEDWKGIVVWRLTNVLGDPSGSSSMFCASLNGFLDAWYHARCLLPGLSAMVLSGLFRKLTPGLVRTDLGSRSPEIHAMSPLFLWRISPIIQFNSCKHDASSPCSKRLCINLEIQLTMEPQKLSDVCTLYNMQ